MPSWTTHWKAPARLGTAALLGSCGPAGLVPLSDAATIPASILSPRQTAYSSSPPRIGLIERVPSEVDTGSREETRQKTKDDAPFLPFRFSSDGHALEQRACDYPHPDCPSPEPVGLTDPRRPDSFYVSAFLLFEEDCSLSSTTKAGTILPTDLERFAVYDVGRRGAGPRRSCRPIGE